jgi:prepilin-type processing-associated H-X9-DG protein
MTSDLFPDVPASSHSKGCSFSFADGHSEIRRWKNPNTIKPVLQLTPPLSNVAAGPNNVDLIWLRERTTVLK